MTKGVSEADLKALSDAEQMLPATLEVSDNLPAISGIPLHAQHILCLIACGWSYRQVSSTFGCTPQSVHYYVQRYDPDHSITLTREARRNFLYKLWEARCGEALMAVTPEKLLLASARDLTDIARKSVQSMNELASKGKSETSRGVAELLDRLCDVEDAMPD